MCGGNEDCAMWVSSLTNEEPLLIVKACVDTVWEVIREDGRDGRGGVVWKGETSLRRGRCRSILERAVGAEDGDVSRDRGSGAYRGSEVFAPRGGDEDIVGVDGDVLVERGEKESIENFLGDLGGSRGHR